MLRQFEKHTAVLRWLILERQEDGKGARGQPWGPGHVASQGNVPQAVQICLCISASRQVRADFRLKGLLHNSPGYCVP